MAAAERWGEQVHSLFCSMMDHSGCVLDGIEGCRAAGPLDGVEHWGICTCMSPRARLSSCRTPSIRFPAPRFEDPAVVPTLSLNCNNRSFIKYPRSSCCAHHFAKPHQPKPPFTYLILQDQGPVLPTTELNKNARPPKRSHHPDRHLRRRGLRHDRLGDPQRMDRQGRRLRRDREGLQRASGVSQRSAVAQSREHGGGEWISVSGVSGQ